MDPSNPTASPVRRTSPRLAALARQGVSPNYGTATPRRRRRREPELPDLNTIQVPDAMYFDKDNPAGHRIFFFTHIPEPVTYGTSNSTVHRLSFPPVVAQPRLLDLNGTLSLPEKVPQHVAFTLTSIMRDEEYDDRAIYEVRVGRRPYINIASEIPIRYQKEFREYNVIGQKVSRLITQYVFSAHATWRSLNHFRTVYLVISIIQPEVVADMLPRFKSLEDEVVSLLTNTLTALTNFGECLGIIQDFGLFFRSYRKERVTPSRHRRIMDLMDLDFEIFRSSMREATKNFRAAALRNRKHNQIRDWILKKLETTVLPLQL